MANAYIWQKCCYEFLVPTLPALLTCQNCTVRCCWSYLHPEMLLDVIIRMGNGYNLRYLG